MDLPLDICRGTPLRFKVKKNRGEPYEREVVGEGTFTHFFNVPGTTELGIKIHTIHMGSVNAHPYLGDVVEVIP